MPAVATATEAWRLALRGRFRLLHPWCAFVKVRQLAPVKWMGKNKKRTSGKTIETMAVRMCPNANRAEAGRREQKLGVCDDNIFYGFFVFFVRIFLIKHSNKKIRLACHVFTGKQ